MEIAAIVASFVSVILAIVAIWQAMHFYTQGKNTETHVQLALEGIKAQTEALQAINAKTLDRLTKYVTTPRDEPSQAAQLLVTTLRDLPDIVLKLRPPSAPTNEDAFRREIFNAYIALWNYTATANIWASFCLPHPDQFDETQAYHQYVKAVVDRSAADFRYMTGIIQQIRPEDIRTSTYLHMYDEVEGHLRNLVGDTAENFVRKAKQQDPSA